MLFYKGLSEVKDDILGCIKVCFSFDEDFKYNLVNQQASYLKVYDGFPRATRSYPCIIITNATVEPKIWGIGEEFREYSEIAGIGSKEYGGTLDFNITFDCAAESITERTQLADRLIMNLWWNTRRYLEEGGIIVTGFSTGGESDFDYGNDKVFINQVNMKCWIEWTEIVSHDEVEGIHIIMQEIRDIRREKNFSTDEAISTWSKKLINK